MQHIGMNSSTVSEPSLAFWQSGSRASDGGRTRDNWLGKPVLYQLSYARMELTTASVFLKSRFIESVRLQTNPIKLIRSISEYKAKYFGYISNWFDHHPILKS